jgi:hypothetical protein
MPTINLYTRKDHFSSRATASAAPPVTGGTPVIPIVDLYEYDLMGMPVYAFAYQLEIPGSSFVLTPMSIPAYFEEAQVVDGERVDTQGLFLISMGNDPTYTKDFILDRKIFGPYGCPKRVLTSTTNSAKGRIEVFFTFNKMRFYPFILPDFSVGYYVCDGQKGPNNSEPRGAWRPYSPDEDGVALDAPVTYDPTLGLYITRAAHIEPR